LASLVCHSGTQYCTEQPMSFHLIVYIRDQQTTAHERHMARHHNSTNTQHWLLELIQHKQPVNVF